MRNKKYIIAVSGILLILVLIALIYFKNKDSNYTNNEMFDELLLISEKYKTEGDYAQAEKILEESLIISQIHADLLRFETAQDRYLKLCKLMPQVVLRAPLVYVANYLQMTPETLSRVRAASLYADRS